MKSYKYVFLCILIVSLIFGSTVNVFAGNDGTKEYNWFCIRNGSSQPPITPQEALINKYGAISVDRSVSDSSDRKVIYITFDAGYENGNVESVLNTLKNENVCAAFFLLDNIIIKNPDLVTRMANEGHLICNHTKNHKNLCCESFDEIENDIKSLEDICRENTGLEIDKFFRFPEGKYSESALDAVSKLGYRTVFWSFAYADWDNSNQPKRDKAINKILSNTHNGAIILLHPTSKTNAEILPDLIKSWREMGYEFGDLRDIK